MKVKYDTTTSLPVHTVPVASSNKLAVSVNALTVLVLKLFL